MKDKTQKYYQVLSEKGYYKQADRLKFYLEKYLYKGVELQDKKVLDIGGGTGVYGFYPALQGAKSVVIMEPEFDGSTSGVEEIFYQIKDSIGELDNIDYCKDLLQNHRSDQKYDIILLHNSINHLDEEACEALSYSKTARKAYIHIFQMIAKLCAPSCQIIICDCADKSMYTTIGLKNPFAPEIEWHKHQMPSLWADLLEEAGFEGKEVYWSSYNALKRIGRILMGNRLMAFLTFNHFMLRMKYYG